MFQILVVDDDKNTRMLLKAVLQADNYTVFTAENGEAALDVMDKNGIKDNIVPVYNIAPSGKPEGAIHSLPSPSPPLPLPQSHHRHQPPLLRSPCHQQRVALPDPQRTPDLLGDDHSAQLVDPAHNTRCSHCFPASLPVQWYG